MDLIEEIAQHLYRSGWTGNEDYQQIRWPIENEFIERQGSKPSDRETRDVLTRLRELIRAKKQNGD